MIITITTRLTIQEDMTVSSVGCKTEGLPEDEGTPVEAFADTVTDAISAAVKAHNERVFKAETR